MSKAGSKLSVKNLRQTEPTQAEKENKTKSSLGSDNVL